jgi:hypothetical protein
MTHLKPPLYIERYLFKDTEKDTFIYTSKDTLKHTFNAVSKDILIHTSKDTLKHTSKDS